MYMKNTLLLGLAGAAAIYMARKIPAINAVTTNSPFTGDANKPFPLVPEIMPRNGWSVAYVVIPAVGAWYLSR